MHIPRIEVKLIFRDGGHSDFQTKFEWLKERLHHAQELGLTPGQNLEPPPPYELSTPGPSSSRASDNTPASTQARQQPPQPAPDEPPPDYVEAQTQAITMRYEERMREESERQ
jgi:hypothetical protein